MSAYPKFVTFDCYGTLIHFDMAGAAKDLYGTMLDEAGLQSFIRDFSSYRLDEVLGDWKPYFDVVANALERTCRQHALAFETSAAEAIYARVPTWSAHADVPQGLASVAEHIPLVILSNAMEDQISHNVATLGTPFAHVFTAEGAKAYKPRLRAFEYMFDTLNCGPKDVAHVSSSFRYDLMSATDLGIPSRIWVNRKHEPLASGYSTTQIADTSDLAAALGL